MKRILLIAILLVALTASGQGLVPELAEKLISNCKTDHQKVEAIFRWITDNISYTTFSRYKKHKAKFVETEEDEGPLKSLNERVAEQVLRRKSAFCDGFARLFTSLCDYAGIRTEIICGYASGTMNRSKFGVNHYWNAVFLDNKWQLVDATWASGYIDIRSDEFVRNYNGRYFLASPEQFIRDHYPDDPRWTLLDDPKLPEEFRSSPFRQRSFNKYAFMSFWPGKGIIEAAVGDTILLQLEPGRTEAGTIAPSTITDTTLFTYSSSWVFLRPETEVGASSLPGKQQYRFAVSSANLQWLYLLYNDDVVLRYRLKINDRR
jgi:Transglutaminase-like superfamily